MAEYASWTGGTLGTGAAWTSLSGLKKNGGSGMLSGEDAVRWRRPWRESRCRPFPATRRTVARASPRARRRSSASARSRRPRRQRRSTGTGSSIKSAVTPGGVVPPGGSWPSFSDPTAFPVILVNGDLSLPGSGHGLLIVTGKFTLNGNVNWDGVILVEQHGFERE